MMYINQFIRLTFITIFVVFQILSSAQAKDSFGNYLCSFAEVFECSRSTDCYEIMLSDAQLPDHILINTDPELVIKSAPGSEFERSAAIKGIENMDSILAFHGTQNDQLWTITIDKKSNGMAAISTDGYSTYSLFGHCTPLSEIK